MCLNYINLNINMKNAVIYAGSKFVENIWVIFGGFMIHWRH